MKVVTDADETESEGEMKSKRPRKNDANYCRLIGRSNPKPSIHDFEVRDGRGAVHFIPKKSDADKDRTAVDA
jgi:hypothetical protein